MKNTIRLINRIIIFFDLWGSDYYETKINAALAWELAGIFEEHDILNEYEEIEPTDRAKVSEQ
jgi:hypothetical protein